ncbi:MAG: hypothetical protein ABEH47_04170 [Haloferacaceae archaeon]
MRRRHLLRAAPAAFVPVGCLARAPGTGPDESPDTGAELVESDLRVRDTECGQQVDAATVSFDPGGPSVGVDGTVWGADTCHTARLRAATYDAGDDVLTVHVVAVRPESQEGKACGQCIVEIDYAATCAFEGGLPGRVRVVHGTGDRRTVVATAEAP